MDKPFLFLENLLEILPLCLSDDEEINILGKELLDTYDCCLFPLTLQILYRNGSFNDTILSSKVEEGFLGELACEAFDPKNYFAVGYNIRESLYKYWWFRPKEMLMQRLEIYNGN